MRTERFLERKIKQQCAETSTLGSGKRMDSFDSTEQSNLKFIHYEGLQMMDSQV